MTGLLRLFLVVAPWVAVAGGGMLVVLAGLHLLSRRPLPDISRETRLPAVAAILLGVALLGLGTTYLATDGARSYQNLYLLWLALAGLSSLLAAVPVRR